MHPLQMAGTDRQTFIWYGTAPDTDRQTLRPKSTDAYLDMVRLVGIALPVSDTYAIIGLAVAFSNDEGVAAKSPNELHSHVPVSRMYVLGTGVRMRTLQAQIRSSRTLHLGRLRSSTQNKNTTPSAHVRMSSGLAAVQILQD